MTVERRGPMWDRGPARLYVGGRDRIGWVEGMDRQVAAVRRVLERVPWAVGVPVRAMVVVRGAEWGLLARPDNVDGVWVGWPREAARAVERAGMLTGGMRAELARVLGEGLVEA